MLFFGRKKRLTDYAQGAALMAEEPGKRMPPMSVVDYAAIDSGVPAPPFVLSILGPDLLSNWDASDMDAYREKRGRWQAAIVRYLGAIYPGLDEAVVASSFNSALSVKPAGYMWPVPTKTHSKNSHIYLSTSSCMQLCWPTWWQ